MDAAPDLRMILQFGVGLEGVDIQAVCPMPVTKLPFKHLHCSISRIPTLW